MAIYKCCNCKKEVDLDSNNVKTPILCECGSILYLKDQFKNADVNKIFNLIKEIEYASVDENVSEKGKFIKEKSFPEFNLIFRMVNGSSNFDQFTKNISDTLDFMGKYLSESSSIEFGIKPSFLGDINLRNSRLQKILKVLGIDYTLANFKFPNCTLYGYLEADTQNLDKIKAIVNKLVKLKDKIIRYIKSNSLYQKEYVFERKLVKRCTHTKDVKSLDEVAKKIDNCLKLDDTFDLFDFDNKDLQDMLSTLWYAINYLLSLYRPKTIFKFSFGFEQYPSLSSCINNYLFTKYEEIDKLILSKLESLDNNTAEAKRILSKLENNKFLAIEKNEVDPLNVLPSEAKLNSLTGLGVVKDSINKIKTYINNPNNKDKLNIHMCFYGNPGTGKTEVARIIADILYENHILPTNKLIETNRSGLVGRYVGETGIKTENIIKNAMGGVLFIDEAYTLFNEAQEDYGHEAVAVLLQEMERHRGEFCVILAGYNNEMKKLIEMNPGLNSRIQFHIEFPNYTRDELEEICYKMLGYYNIEENALNKILDITDYLRKNVNFSNAREIRNIMDQVIMAQNLRTAGANNNITIEDVNDYIITNNINLPKSTEVKETDRVLSPIEELNELVGLDNVKKMVKRIEAYAKKNNNPSLNLNMCFVGNPGTGKTKVANIISRLLYDIGVLKEAKLVVASSNSLVSPLRGETSKKTKELVDKAMGGVLFIDEAYDLLNTGGEEAINVLLSAMEDNCGRLCVIFAGYKNEIEKFLSFNDGLKSRIQFTIPFDDFSRKELFEIGNKFIKEKGYTASEEVLDKITDIVLYYKAKPSYANARTVRNIVEQIIINQNVRTEDYNSNVIEQEDVEEYLKNENITLNNNITSNSVSYYDKISTLPKLETKFNTEYFEHAVVSLYEDNQQGTGFIISPDGLCLTCNHCIENMTNPQVRIRVNINGINLDLNLKAIVLKQDAFNDIALLQIKDLQFPLTYFNLFKDKEYKYTSLTEFLIPGYPFGGEVFTNLSIVEGKIASVNEQNGRTIVFCDSFGKPGNSGSPVIDKESLNVIGIFWGAICHGNQEINCFTPVELIWNLLK